MINSMYIILTNTISYKLLFNKYTVLFINMPTPSMIIESLVTNEFFFESLYRMN